MVAPTLRQWIVMLWAFAIILVSGCTTDAPYRHIRTDAPSENEEFYKPNNCEVKDFRHGPPTEVNPCYSKSVERTDKYTLFFIEFDEQGRFYDRRKFDDLTNYLKKRKSNPNIPTTGENNGISIITFVHGWRNNARYDNGNVKLARKTLEFTYTSENNGPHYNPSMMPREVVGIYVGWRGASTSLSDFKKSGYVGDLWEGFSIFDRKNTAQLIATGSVRELFSTIKAYQDKRNYDAEKNDECKQHGTDSNHVVNPDANFAIKKIVYQCKPIRHLIVGHSLGALIVYNAISQQLLESITQGVFSDSDIDCKQQDNGMPGRAMVSSYADMVILLNPAVEGARYEPLHAANVERSRKTKEKTKEKMETKNIIEGAYCPGQKPVLVVLSSAGDFPNKNLFPIARTLTTVFESNQPQNESYKNENELKAPEYIAEEESRSSRYTMGFNDRYTSHELMGWEKFTNRYLQKEFPENNFNSPLKIYAKNLKDYCEDKKYIDGNPISSTLHALRCMTVEAANDAVNTLPEESDKNKQLFISSVTDINIARMLRARSNIQYPPEEAATAINNNPISSWSVNFAGGTVLRHIEDKSNTSQISYLNPLKLDSMQSSYGPLWMIHVDDDSVMKNHNDIGFDGEKYRGRLMLFLQQIYHSVVIKTFDLEVIQGFECLAKVDADQPDQCK